MRRPLAAMLAGLAFAACRPGASSPSGPDASAAVAACENLARQGCALGGDPECPGRIVLAVAQHHTTAGAVECARLASSSSALILCSPYFAGCAYEQ